jgi:GAF domain-containing protein
LLSRVDRTGIEAALTLLNTMTEDLSLATSDSVSLRMLSEDGRWLRPVAAYHPDPSIRAMMLNAMQQSAQTATSGLWRPVIEERRPVRTRVPPGSIPETASPLQADHLRRFPIRAVLGVPLITPDDELVGGVALVRYHVDEELTDDDERLLTDFALRVALVVQLYRRFGELGDAELLAL